MTAAPPIPELFQGGGEVVFPPDSVLNQVEYIRHTAEGGVECNVPFGLINHGAVAVSEQRVTDLQSYLLTTRADADGAGSGMWTPFLLCEIVEDGVRQQKLEIADGYHRDEAMVRLNGKFGVDYRQERVFSIVIPDCSPEDLLDYRIKSASMHDKVSFARASLWILDYWEKTDWSKKIGADQAWGITAADTSGEGFGLTADEANEIKHWVRTKSAMWNKSLGTLHSALQVSSVAEPGLVASVRSSRGRGVMTALSQQHLKALTGPDAFPGRSNWDIQKALASFITQYKIPASKVSQLISSLHGARTLDTVTEALSELNVASLAASSSGSRRRSAGSDGGGRGNAPAFDPRGLVEELRAARLESVVDKLVIARQGLMGAVHLRKYLAPAIGSNGHQAFSIDVDGNEQLQRMLTEKSNGGVEAMLRKLGARTAKLYSLNNPVDLELANSKVSDAIDRVVADSIDGPLRFFSLNNATFVSNLLYAAIGDEVRMEIGEETPEFDVDPTFIRGGSLEIALGKVVNAYPTFSGDDKSLIPMHGMLGVGVQNIGYIKGADPARVGNAILLTAGRLAKASSQIVLASQLN